MNLTMGHWDRTVAFQFKSLQPFKLHYIKYYSGSLKLIPVIMMLIVAFTICVTAAILPNG